MSSVSSIFCTLVVYGSLIHFYPSCMNVIDLKTQDPSYGTTWMFFPDETGKPHVISLNSSSITPRAGSGTEDIDSKIFIWLYTKKFRDFPIKLKSYEDLDNRDVFNITSKYDSRKLTKVIIHGWKNSLYSDAIQVVKNAYLNEKDDVNVIAVDWTEMANDNNYLKSAAMTRSVGLNVAKAIDFMVEQRGAKLEDFHLIGHSLGAHIAGHVGMYIKSGKIARITGLDPALPGFSSLSNNDYVLDRSDANFVDVIHTCSGMLGHTENLGHADFYPNNGKPRQPGCTFPLDFIGACSHGRSYQYFAESIETKTGFMSIPCNSWENYVARNCAGRLVPMGHLTPNTTRGQFFLETSTGPKFARYDKINY